MIGALNHTGGTLITGPGDAKYDLRRYIEQRRPDLDAQVRETGTEGSSGDAALPALGRRLLVSGSAAGVRAPGMAGSAVAESGYPAA